MSAYGHFDEAARHRRMLRPAFAAASSPAARMLNSEVSQAMRLHDRVAGMASATVPRALRSGLDAAAAAERMQRRDRVATRAAMHAVQEATSVLREAELFMPVGLSARAAIGLGSSSSPLSIWTTTQLRSAEWELTNVATSPALDAGLNRRVQTTLGRVRGVLRADAASRRAAATLGRSDYSLGSIDRIGAISAFRLAENPYGRYTGQSGLGVPQSLLDAAALAERLARREPARADAPSPVVVTVEDEGLNLVLEGGQEQAAEAITALIALVIAARARGAKVAEWTDARAEQAMRAVEVGFEDVSLTLDRVERGTREWVLENPLWPYTRFVAIKPYLSPSKIRDIKDPLGHMAMGLVGSGTASWVFSANTGPLTGAALVLAAGGTYFTFNNLYRRVEALDREHRESDRDGLGES